jgi:hypothetical protein
VTNSETKAIRRNLCRDKGRVALCRSHDVRTMSLKVKTWLREGLTEQIGCIDGPIEAALDERGDAVQRVPGRTPVFRPAHQPHRPRSDSAELQSALEGQNPIASIGSTASGGTRTRCDSAGRSGVDVMRPLRVGTVDVSSWGADRDTVDCGAGVAARYGGPDGRER